jgi:hypothetical protein
MQLRRNSFVTVSPFRPAAASLSVLDRRYSSMKKFTESVAYRLRWVNLPVGVLVALLQRTPALRMAAAAGDYVIASPVGQVLRAAFTLAALGAMHSRAGATTFVTSQSSPVSGNVGQPISYAFTYTGTPSLPQSFTVSGTLPPGLSFIPAPLNGVLRTGTPAISGTPTQAGTYSISVRGIGVGGQGPLEPIQFVIAPASTATPPVITSQPVPQSVAAGATVVFRVVATGSSSLTYQWRKDDRNLAGATSATLVLSGAAVADEGVYSVAVNNAGAVTTSSPVPLTVTENADLVRLINLSILTDVTAADPSFTLGTVIGGPGTIGTKPLLIRAAGPALGRLGVSGALADPKLELFTGPTVTAENDNWGGVSALVTAFSQVGAFAYETPNSKDAALFDPRLAGGPYTVKVSGVGGATGPVIAELYDATSNLSVSASTPRLVNVSVLKQIATGSVLTAGFVIGGGNGAARTVLIRAIGPTLATAFNVPGAMTDPKLELFSGQTVIAANDNWGGDAQLTAIGNRVAAFKIDDGGSRDAVLLLTLAPGNYTAQVSAVAGGGLALVEVYEIP